MTLTLEESLGEPLMLTETLAVSLAAGGRIERLLEGVPERLEVSVSLNDGEKVQEGLFVEVVLSLAVVEELGELLPLVVTDSLELPLEVLLLLSLTLTVPLALGVTLAR